MEQETGRFEGVGRAVPAAIAGKDAFKL